ncbi:MAG: hypothetical protein V7604_843 [Hyphomicrobiales bacterium]|jgi:hypothetical protein
MQPLKLIALDPDDIAVVSTHLQDAVVTVADVVWLPSEHRLVIGMNRFDWEACGCDDPCYKRRRTALRFDRVMAVRCRNMDCKAKDTVLNLLAVEYDETDAPAGTVTLIFSGGAALRLEVECLECELTDLGPTWDVKARPEHVVNQV